MTTQVMEKLRDYRPLGGLLFDMDGTLVNTEDDTDAAILEAMALRGVEQGTLHPSLTRGRSWRDITEQLFRKYRLGGSPQPLEEDLIRIWTERVSVCVEPLTGAIEMLRSASEVFPVAVVSSSPHALIDRLLEACGASRFVPSHHRVGADDVKTPKPAPECFLRGAEILGVPPSSCLVFEDSTAGLRAADAAGMPSIAVLEVCAQPDECMSLATASIGSYPELPVEFWARLREAP